MLHEWIMKIIANCLSFAKLNIFTTVKSTATNQLSAANFFVAELYVTKCFNNRAI